MAAGTQQPLRVGVAGLGHVGAAVVRLLQSYREVVSARAGREIRVVAVSARDETRDRGFHREGIAWHTDPAAIATAADVDVVVELIGGDTGAAWEVVSAALAAGKPVVTANKALLALRAADVVARMRGPTAPLFYEAAVAGGIPVIKTLREGLSANSFRAVYGILNGTSNYILSTMAASGRDFADVLAEAQALGYAEADPAFDIDGHDAGHKLALLSALAFGGLPDVAGIRVEGIRGVTSTDSAYARELGYAVRLLGVARMTADGRLWRSVGPCLVPRLSPLATVEGPLNAVYADTSHAGRILLTGAGAGGEATASAVVADLIDLARGQAVPFLGRFDEASAPAPAEEAEPSRFYLRLQVLDRPGVMADVAAILRDCDISLETVLQRGRDPGQEVSVVMTTHEAAQAALDRAAGQVSRLEAVAGPPHVMRIEGGV